MIWATSDDHQHTLAVLSNHLADELARPVANSLSPHELEELTRGVLSHGSLYVDENGISSDYLALMTARALWSLGEEEAARNYLGAAYPREGKDEVSAFLEATARCQRSGWELLASRTLRPSQWVTMASTGAWILDFKQIQLADPMAIELWMFQVVKSLVQSVFPMWDTTSGKGMLGLAGLPRAGRRASRKTDVQKLIFDWCEWMLSKAALDRDWGQTPGVLLLDLK